MIKDDRTLLIELDNGEKENFSWFLNYTALLELFSLATLDASYKYVLSDCKVTPALRYMHQFDHEAGEMGGANFKAYDLHALTHYAIQDFDDKNPGVQADSNVIQFDSIKRFKFIPNFYAKLRMVRV